MYEHSEPHWRDRAACLGLPHEWWFPNPENHHSPTTRTALAVCKQCPVTVECLEDAARHETSWNTIYGIRGGRKANQRVKQRYRL